MFIRFDMIHERDRRTDRQTDGHRMTAIAALMHSIARQKSSDFNEIWYTTAHLELSNSQMTKCDFKKFKMADGRHFKNCFGHTSAVDCPISVVKLCVEKHAVFFTEFRQWNRYPRSTERIFCFPNRVWASASDGFCIVSNTLVYCLVYSRPLAWNYHGIFSLYTTRWREATRRKGEKISKRGGRFITHGRWQRTHATR